MCLIKLMFNSDHEVCVITSVYGSTLNFSDFGIQLVVHPRNVTVLKGDSYSVECVGVQNAVPDTKTTFHSGGLEVTVMSYVYPSNTGFPVYMSSASLDEPNCYFCVVMSDPFNPDQDYFRATNKSYITVHGKD